MIKILFVCHGNICRSPMAEFVMKELVRRAGRQDDFLIESAATSREELGNDMHYGTKTKLREMGIPFSRRAARQIRPDDYDKYDKIYKKDEHIRIWLESYSIDREYVDKQELKEKKKANKVKMSWAAIQELESKHNIPVLPAKALEEIKKLFDK